jgi:hypothetical protein
MAKKPQEAQGRTVKSGAGAGGLGGGRFRLPAMPGLVEPVGLRTLGPGSVSSFLKVVLDVFYVGLTISFAALVIGGVGLLLFQPIAATVVNVDLQTVDHGPVTDLMSKPPALALFIVIVAAYVGVLLLVVNRLRRVFGTLTAGDPFRPENVNRLRTVGFALIVMEGLGFLIHRLAAALVPAKTASVSLSLNLTGAFAILVVFVLAEVFREGARLRREAELTI